MSTVRKVGIIVGIKLILVALFIVLWNGFSRRFLFMGGLFYVLGITIIGICDTLNHGVEKREKAQAERSARLERNQELLQEQVARRQQKLDDDMKRRQANM